VTRALKGARRVGTEMGTSSFLMKTFIHINAFSIEGQTISAGARTPVTANSILTGRVTTWIVCKVKTLAHLTGQTTFINIQAAFATLRTIPSATCAAMASWIIIADLVAASV